MLSRIEFENTQLVKQIEEENQKYSGMWQN